MKKLITWFETKFPTDEDKFRFYLHATFIFGILSLAGHKLLFG